MIVDLPWYVFALLGALLVGLAGTLEKKVLVREAPMHFSLASSALIGVLSLPFLPFVAWEQLSTGILLALYALSVISFTSFCLVAFALKRLEAGEQGLLLALSPAVTALAAFAILGETISVHASLGIGLIVAGLILLELPHLRTFFSGLENKSKLLALVATGVAVGLYAVGSLSDRALLAGYGVRPLDLIVVTQVFILVNGAVLWAFLRRHQSLSLSFEGQTLGVTGFAVLLFGARLCYAFSVASVFVALAVALKRMSVIVTIFSANAYLHERALGHKLIVAGLMLAGGLLIVL